MADKSFGLKQINMIGVGTPTVESSTDLVVNTNGSERIRITSSGNVGIGTTIPIYSASYGNLSLVGGNGGQVEFKGTTANKASYIYGAEDLNLYTGTGGDIVFYTGGANERARFNSTGNLAFPSGAGIDFSATSDATGMTSELLDDYEEGTWVPRLSGTSGGEYTPGGSNVGYYVKVGNLVKVSCTLHWTAQVTAYGSNLVITGLPYASRTTYRHAGTISAISSGLTLSANYNRFSITHDPSASQAYIIQNKTDGNGYAHSAGTVATSGLIYSISWTYVTT